MKEEKQVVVPPNEIVTVFGQYRIIKKYYISYKQIDYYLVLESRKMNLAGEAYYSIALDNPNHRGESVEQQHVYKLLNEYDILVSDLLKELAK